MFPGVVTVFREVSSADTSLDDRFGSSQGGNFDKLLARGRSEICIAVRFGGGLTQELYSQGHGQGGGWEVGGS